MQNSRTLEIWVGLFVAIGLMALFFLSLQVSQLQLLGSGDTYTVIAKFHNASGLKEKAPVTMAGVRIGQVGSIRFDPTTFEAVVTLEIEATYNQIPADSGASILTAGLLGEKYVGLEPGGDMESLQQGSELMLTQSSIVLEKLISQFLFNKADAPQ